MSDERTLVVGTTPDYIAYIDQTFQGRAVFVTERSLRESAVELPPDEASEVLCSLSDTAATLKSIAAHLRRHQQSVNGVTCYDCEWLLLAAIISEQLDQPFPSAESVRLARNKLLTKQKWTEFGVRSPLFELVRNGFEAVRFTERLGRDVVLKPLTGSGSELTFRCDSSHETARAFALIRDGLRLREGSPLFMDETTTAEAMENEPAVLVEEFISGREFSADFIIRDSEVSIVRVAKKYRGEGMPFGTTLAYEVPARLPGWLTLADLRRRLGEAAAALGLSRALCMVDFVISRDEVVFLELTPRIGGDCLPPLIKQSSGFDTIGLALDFATDRHQDIPPPDKWQRRLAFRLFAPHSGILTGIDIGDLETDPRFKEIYEKRGKGHTVIMPPEDYASWSLGHVILAVSDDEDISARVENLQKTIKINLEPHYKYDVSGPGPGGSTPPRLDHEELMALVRSFQNDRDRYLNLLGDSGSPLYVIDTGSLTQKARRFREAFNSAFGNIGIYYALKSNSHPLIAKTLIREGLGLDVSSGLELQFALEWGADNIVFSGPGKRPAELELALDNAGQVTILIDSFTELAMLNEMAAQRGIVIKAGVRLTTEDSGIWRKFGIPLAQLAEFFEKADTCKNVRLRGLQFHISWNLNPEAQVAFIATLGARLHRLPARHRGQIEFIDIGGGFWPEAGEWLQPAATRHGMILTALGDPPSHGREHYRHSACHIDEFASSLAQAFKQHLPDDVRCSTYTEPGRWLCNDAMHILLTVVDRKSPEVVITDGGTNAVGWERFETDYFPVINLTRPALRERACLVAGSLCTPHDIWGYSYFGEDIQRGDILLVPNQGAYTYSLRQDFIKPLPTSAMLQARDTGANPKNRLETQKSN